ncbi:GDP-mannose mannosyl hydrolase, partial [Shewanella sp.]|uniref:GDP-mannose mannosyl hydrolase n=1 Tax=Shewanella sp. TaxID=50422 RepID=UPI003D1043B2
PLISIDLIVSDGNGHYLIGMRNNRPAKGYWFVPGGRILKDETLNSAYERILQMELGLKVQDVSRSFLGVYEHFYDDNFSGSNFSTHYVVLGYKIQTKQSLQKLPNLQHSEYQWLSCQEILQLETVHKNTKLYFSEMVCHQ